MTDGPVALDDERSTGLREALRRAASALRAGDVGFALAGGYALWVYGAPEPAHDVDLVVSEDDVEAAASVLADAGFTVERPVEDWLFKAYLDGALVDVLHRINGVRVQEATMGSADELEVLAIGMPVLPPTVVFTQKMLALNEHHCDFGKLLPGMRAVRERIDWPRLRAATASNDFAVALLVLAERLGLATRP